MRMYVNITLNFAIAPDATQVGVLAVVAVAVLLSACLPVCCVLIPLL